MSETQRYYKHKH